MRFLSTTLVLLLFLIVSLPAFSRPVVAIGYIENRSGNRNYDYLETIFANSFGNSLRNIFDNIRVIKPLKLSRGLKAKKIKLKKRLPYEKAVSFL